MAVIDNLIGYWAMNEASGNALDSHSNSLTLTDNATVGAGSGKVSGGRVFLTANSEYFSRASEALLQAGDINFSFAFWINFSDVASNQILIGKDVDAPANSRDYTIELNSGDPKVYINGGGAGLEVAWGATLSTSTWYHLACGHSAAADELWIVINAGTPSTASTSGTVPQTSAAEFRIGARAYSGFEQYLAATMDEVGYWKRDIRSDVSWLYNAGSGRSYADIVAESGGAPVVANMITLERPFNMASLRR